MWENPLWWNLKTENCLDITAVLSAQCIETLTISWNSEIKYSKKTLNKNRIDI